MQDTVKRLQSYLSGMKKKYPDCWKWLEKFYFEKGKKLPTWPDWCFVPVSGAYSIVSNGQTLTDPRQTLDVAILHALGAWRLSQGIYEFDERLYNELVKTPFSGEIPVQALYGLPEWCVYIKCPNEEDIHGFFVSLEYDSNNGESELRFLFDSKITGLFPLIVHLGSTVEEGIKGSINYASESLEKTGIASHKKIEELFENGDLKEEIQTASNKPKKFLPLVLYLCSKKPDYDNILPSNKPEPTKTKKGKRIFPAKGPKHYKLGYRIGEFLTQSKKNFTSTETGFGSSKVAHIRRAHWHTYWTGPKKEPGKQKPVLRWIPPIPVGFQWDEVEQKLIPTVKKIKE